MGIEILETGSMQSALQGWAGSRDLQGLTGITEVASLDASVNELPSAMFYFRNMMILERELVVTPRNHVIWARTSRVDDPRNFKTPPEFELPTTHSMIRETMHQASKEGMHQDQWRLALPLCSLTSWTTRLSFRDAVRLCLYFKDVAAWMRKANPLLAGRLQDTANQMRHATLAAFVGLDIDLVDYALARFKKMKLQTASLGTGQLRRLTGEFVTLQVDLPIATRAQLVRHREIVVVDDLLRVINSRHSEQLPISTMVTVQATALSHVWATVLGKRTCWMAQADLWQPLTDLYGGRTDGLPCADGHCPYAEDAKQRLAGNDPGAPCPRYSNLTNTPLNDSQWEAAMLEAKERPNATMWKAELGVRHVQQEAVNPDNCKHAKGCPFPETCKAEGHCDAAFNGYR
jgi:hypothetical protein